MTGRSMIITTWTLPTLNTRHNNDAKQTSQDDDTKPKLSCLYLASRSFLTLTAGVDVSGPSEICLHHSDQAHSAIRGLTSPLSHLSEQHKQNL